MARLVHTDDAARRLEYRHTVLGYRVRIPMIAAAFVLIPASLVVAWWVTGPVALLPLDAVTEALLRGVLAVVLGPVLVIRALMWFDRHVTPERPIRFWREALRLDLNSPRRPQTRTQVLDATGLRPVDETRDGRRAVTIPMPDFTGTSDAGHPSD